MKLKAISPKEAVKSDNQTVEKSQITALKSALSSLISELDKNISSKKEHAERIQIMTFLKAIDYSDKDFAYEDGGIDLAIKANDKFGVIFETKSSLETKDMISHDNLNVKPMQQVIFYYLQQRSSGNNEIKQITVTNGYEWYIFDALDFNRLFFENSKLKRDFEEHQIGAKSGKSTKNFYEEIAKPFLNESNAELKTVYFKLKDYTKANQTDLKALYKLLKSDFLLKKKKQIDSNKLNTKFFKELLYIMGLEEQKEGSKKIIREKEQPDEGSLLENLKAKIESHGVLDDFQEIEKYGETYTEQLFNISLELVLTWINRLLFLKLLEGQLVDYHKSDSDTYKFLSYKKVNEFDILDALFFKVLNVPSDKRPDKIKERYPNIPYLNSSLFEPSKLEKKVAFISAMENDLTLPLLSQSVLTDETVKELPTLEYLLKFMDAYNFASHTEDDVYTEKGELINASVLGLVFEKINGYKEGSFYTPGFITEYMARETIRKAVIQKFNDAYKTDIADFDELRNFTIGNVYKKDKILEYNQLINSLKIVDPAVGSGHFLVSSLNELLLIKSELGILADEQGNKLACRIEIENDTAIINDSENELFRYSLDEKNKIIESKNKIQSGIFYQKKSIIENCLFGVDINPNSVKICRLRLWIELLKNAYYKEDIQLETLPNIDINIKEGNSLISRFSLDADIKKALKKSKWDIASYQNAVKTYHEATNKEQKREMLKLIETIKNDFETEITTNDKRFIKLNKLKGELFQVQNQGGLFEMSKTEKEKWNKEVTKLTSEIRKLETELEDIKNNVIYRNAFEWRFEFPEVLDDAGNFVGFDVVIGNPPYIRHEEIKKYKSFFEKEFKVYSGTADLYAYFIEQGINLLKNKASFTFIVPNKWMRANYGTKLRSYIKKMQIIKLIDFGDLPVFEEATTYPNIIVLKNDLPKNTFIALIFKTLEYTDNIENYITQEGFNVSIKDLNENGWVLIDVNTQNLMNKLKKQGKPLGEYVNNNIYYGVKTGLNEAFVIDEMTKNKLIEEDPKSADIIKPFLAGRDIKRFQHPKSNKFLIFSRRGIDIEKYPSVHLYLKQYREQLEPKPANWKNKEWKGRKAGSYKWFEIQDAVDYYLEFEKNKIMFPDIAIKNQALIDDKGHYCVNTAYIIPDMTLSDLGIFNSKLMLFFYMNISSSIRGGYLRFIRQYVEQLPFIKTNILKDKVTQILTQKKENPEADTSKLEAEIDKMVYELYGLTKEEIKIVEGSVK